MIVLFLLPIIFVLLLAFGVLPFSVACIPILLCGEIATAQLVKVIKQKDFMFNVYFYVWVFTIISTFIAPCINLYHDEWVSYWPRPNSWVPYAFWTSLMYLVGIIIWSSMLREEEKPIKPSHRVLKPNWKFVLIVFMLISLAAQLYVYYLAGGILGYMMRFTDEADAFEGMGLFFILSESFPYIFLLYILLNSKKRLKRFQFFLLILTLFIITMFFGGLRGSRSNTILFMVIAVIMLNIFLYRIKTSDIVVLLIAFFVFMYVGRLYKDYGVNMIYEESAASLSGSSMNSTESVITGDLSRYSVNAYQLFLMRENPKHGIHSSFQKAHGQTYLWGFLTFVPGGKVIINKYHLQSRTYFATALFFGNQPNRKNTRILGPMGEWFINFGYFTFFVPYLILGYLFRYFRNITKCLPKNDVMFLVVPSFLTWLPQLVLADFSNIMFFFVKRVFIIWLILRLITKKSISLENNNQNQALI